MRRTSWAATRRAVGVLLVAVLAALAGTSLAGCAQPTESAPTPAAEASRWGEDAIISATGKVLPRERAELAFRMSGPVGAVRVRAGERVVAGQVLAELEIPELRAAVNQAEAGLAAAGARLAQMEAAAPDAQVHQAEAALATAREQAHAALLQAEAVCSQVESAQAGVLTAQATQAKLLAGATANERELARLGVERAKAELYGLQGRRDAIGGLRRSTAYEKGSFEAAEGQVFAAEMALKMAEVQQQIVAEGAQREDVALAKAQVVQAEAALASAEAQCLAARGQAAVAERQVAGAQAALEGVLASPREADLAIARAAVAQAQAALDAAEASLANAQIASPIAGVVTRVDLRGGELALPGAPALWVGQIEELFIETTDLDEIDVARIREGSPAEVTFDALPGVALRTQVESVALMAGSGSGGTTFRVTLALPESPPELRWGMTAFVDIEAE